MKQNTQLQGWLDGVFTKFLKEHGPFVTVNEQILAEDEFMHLYDMIESQARFKLYTLRTSNEKKRMNAFHQSFFDAKSTNA